MAINLYGLNDLFRKCTIHFACPHGLIYNSCTAHTSGKFNHNHIHLDFLSTDNRIGTRIIGIQLPLLLGSVIAVVNIKIDIFPAIKDKRVTRRS